MLTLFNYGRKVPIRNSRRLILLACAVFSYCYSVAQDAVITPDGSTHHWVNGATFSGVTATGNTGSWQNIGRVTDSDTDNYAHISRNGTGSLSGSLSVSDGNDYSTTPFTGYYVGVNIDRNAGAGTWTAFETRVETFLNGAATGESHTHTVTLLNPYSSNVGFYAHGDFDEVRVTVSGSAATISSAQIRVKNVYLQRYTRSAPCNTPSPMVGPGLTATPGLTIGLWTGVNNLEDNNPATVATFYSAIASSYQMSVKDDAVLYPAGTFGGFRISAGDALQTSLIELATITLYNDNTVVDTRTGAALLTGSTINSDGTLTVGMVASGEFNRIVYNVTNISFSGLTAATFHYPVIISFCENPVTCNPAAPAPAALTQGNGTDINYPVYITSTAAAIGCLDCKIENADRVVDNDPDNYATISQAVTGLSSYYLGVKSEQVFPAGYYAGMEIEDYHLGSISAGIGHMISTYLGGVKQEEYQDGGGLAATKFFVADGRHLVGFKTTKDFDEIRLEINSIGSIGIYGTRVYGAVVEPFCTVTELACNTASPLARSAHAVFIDGKNTGVSDIGSVNNYIGNADRLVDDVPGNYASIVTAASANVTASIAVQDGGNNFAPGSGEKYFVGFDIENASFITSSFLNSITIQTLDAAGEPVETVNTSGSLFSIGSSLATGTGRQTVGFLATDPFTGVKLVINKSGSVTLGEVRVYSAVIKKFCAGEELVCGELTPVTNPGYPVFVDGRETGFTGVASGGNNIDNSEYAIDDDAATYATIRLGATALSSTSFAIANAIETYPASTYAGFDIGSATLFNAGVLSSMTIQLLNDGVVVQNDVATALLGGVTSSIGTGGYQRQVIGIVGHVPFDEVKITFTNGAAVDLGVIRIYGAVFQPFLDEAGEQVCEEIIECQSTYVLTNSASPGDKTASAVINFEHTGATGALAANYGVENPWNVVSESTTDYATLHNGVSGGNTVSLSVATPGVVFPKGTFAGFTIKKNSFVVSGDIFPFITVTTYLKGTEQESQTSGALADLTLLVQWFGTPADFYNPGFKTTKPFDEVRITIGSLVGAIQQFVDVYGAYVDTREAAPEEGDGSTPIACPYPDLSPSISFIPATITGPAEVGVVLKVYEFNDVATNGLITVYIPKDPLFTLSFSSAAGTVGGQAVQNSNWTFDAAGNPSYYILTTNAVIPASGLLSAGFTAAVTPGAVSGQTTISAIILSESGGEKDDTNNVDDDTLDYKP